MFGVKVSSDWNIPESDITSEEIYLNRRQFLENTGKLGSHLLALSALPTNVSTSSGLKYFFLHSTIHFPF